MNRQLGNTKKHVTTTKHLYTVKHLTKWVEKDLICRDGFQSCSGDMQPRVWLAAQCTFVQRPFILDVPGSHSKVAVVVSINNNTQQHEQNQIQYSQVVARYKCDIQKSSDHSTCPPLLPSNERQTPDNDIRSSKAQNSMASAPSCLSLFSAGFSSSIKPATNLRK